jgi:hypothetical protein
MKPIDLRGKRLLSVHYHLFVDGHIFFSIYQLLQIEDGISSDVFQRGTKFEMNLALQKLIKELSEESFTLKYNLCMSCPHKEDRETLCDSVLNGPISYVVANNLEERKTE